MCVDHDPRWSVSPPIMTSCCFADSPLSSTVSILLSSFEMRLGNGLSASDFQRTDTRCVLIMTRGIPPNHDILLFCRQPDPNRPSLNTKCQHSLGQCKSSCFGVSMCRKRGAGESFGGASGNGVDRRTAMTE